LDCGGKRSATPLLGVASVAKAVSPLRSATAVQNRGGRHSDPDKGLDDWLKRAYKGLRMFPFIQTSAETIQQCAGIAVRAARTGRRPAEQTEDV
jgi:hypothetical protein